MSDTVRRIEDEAFHDCTSLSYVRLSRNLEFIGEDAFYFCKSLTSIFIPPSCREICDWASQYCEKLIILSVPQHTQIGRLVIDGTALFEASPFSNESFDYYENNNNDVNGWIKAHHVDNEFSLHRACTSFNPLDEVIFDIIKRQGLKAFKNSDRIGVTASQYLSKNTFADIEEKQIMKRYILDMMGEVI